MRVYGLKGARRFVRWLGSRMVNGALILGYHRIADVAHDPYGICVSPEHFAEQLDVLHRYARPASLPQLARDLGRDRLPDRSVVLTFDDGYADILNVVQPLLVQYGIPATVFVATGYLGRAFWWDALQLIVYGPDELPARLSLQMGGSRLDWNAGAGRRGGDEDSVREQLLWSLYRLLLPLHPDERDEAMANLHAWSGAQVDRASAGRALSEAEVAQLASCPVVEIGAHTVTHPVLARAPLPAQRREIEESKAYLEALLGRPVTAFSYPNGSWSTVTEAVVRASGFTAACGSRRDVTWRGSNRFHLPRFWVRDEDGASFSRWLRTWLKA